MLRTDDNVPEAIPNKTLIDLIVSNDSKSKPAQKTGASLLGKVRFCRRLVRMARACLHRKRKQRQPSPMTTCQPC